MVRKAKQAKVNTFLLDNLNWLWFWEILSWEVRKSKS